MASKITDMAAQTIDYRLNQLGIRVTPAACHLIAVSKNGWRPIGFARELPLKAPKGEDEMRASLSDPLQMTAQQYIAAHPDTDLADVLMQIKPFAEALKDPDCKVSG